jgi:hypothetical protein
MPQTIVRLARTADQTWAVLCLLSVVAGIACPALLAVRGPQAHAAIILAAVLPVLWIIRWNFWGFTAGVLFIWLSLYATGLSSTGPGQVDNLVPALTSVYGGVCGFAYLGPVLLLRLSIGRMLKPARAPEPADDQPLPGPGEVRWKRDLRSAVWAFGALAAAFAAMHLAWGLRSRHPQEEAIEALERAGARIVLDSSLPGEPVQRVLHGFGGKLTDAEMPWIAQFDGLVELDLHASKVTDAGLERLGGLRALKKLNLQKTAVTDAGLAHLQEMPALEELWLHETHITDAGLARLKPLVNLHSLGLYRCRGVTDGGLAALKDLPGLRFVQIEGTRITEAGTKELKKTRPEMQVVGGPKGP